MLHLERERDRMINRGNSYEKNVRCCNTSLTNEFTFSKWQILTYYGQQIFIEQIIPLSHYPKKKKKTHNPTQDGSMTKSFKTKHLIDLWMIPS